MSKTKPLVYIIYLILCVAVLLIPLPADDVLLKFTLAEIDDTGFQLFYKTKDNDEFDSNRIINADIDEKHRRIVFRIDGSEAGRLTGLRLDFPSKEQTLEVTGVCATSGGLIADNWSPTDFISNTGILYANNTEVMTVPSNYTTYIDTSETDPYIIFSENIVNEVNKQFSHKYLTRIFVLGMIFLGIIFYKKPVFTEET